MMYYEIFHNGNLINRGTSVLSELSWDNELMYTPNMSVTLPITEVDYIHPNDQFKLFVNDKVFWGIIVDFDLNKEEETIDLEINHIVHEWEFREISVNNAIKEKNVNIIYQEEVEKTVETTSDDNNTDKAIEWFEQKKGKVKYSMAKRYGPGSYDCSSAVYTALVYAGIFPKGKMGTTATLGRDLTAIGWVKTTSPVRGDIFVWTAGQGGHKYGHTGMFLSPTQIIHMNGGANGISVNKFTYKFATIYHDPKSSDGTKTTETVKELQDIDPKIVDKFTNIYEDRNFAYPGWELNFSKKATEQKIDYVYSRQNKLEALTKTCELTDDLFWRVRFVDEKVIDISEFGEQKPYVISMKPSGVTNIRILTEPTIDYDFENVINVATVYSAKTDTGMSAVTMRDVYEDESLQEDGFPVIILRGDVNNERDYSKYIEQPKAIAPNNELEYAVLDLESIAQMSGYLREGSFAFNDISPFAVDQENGKTTKITDKDRILAATQAYKATIKKLKQARMRYSIEITTEQIPNEVNVGDKVRFIYDNELFILEACSSYMQKILSYDDYFYVTRIEYEIDESGAEIDTITLEKELRIEREEINET